MAAALLTAVAQAGDIEGARRLYRSLLPLSPPGGDFFRRLLRLEMEHAAAAAVGGASGALPPRQLQDLFEAAVDAYGSQDVQLWLLYAEWQASRGAAGDPGSVHWKARRALGEGAAGAFETAFQLGVKLQVGC